MTDSQAATRAALENIAEHGSNMSVPLLMDFFVAVPDLAAGQVVATRASELGFTTEIVRDEESDSWTCNCSRFILPNFETVWAIEQELDALGQDVGAYSDGFGTLGNTLPHA